MSAPPLKVFISYSSEDRDFVKTEIVALLSHNGLEPWWSQDAISGGERWEHSILKGLEGCDRFLVVLTPRSVASRWVAREVSWAMANRDGRIIPVLRETCSTDALHFGLREIQHVDFRANPEAARAALLVNLRRPLAQPAAEPSGPETASPPAGLGAAAGTRTPDLPAALRAHVCSFEAFIDDRTRGFVGRQFVFDALDRFLGEAPSASGYFVVRGEPGIGKTALVAQLVKTRGCVHHFNVGLQAINTPRHFMGNVCAQLIGRFGLPHASLPDDLHESGRFLNRVLHEAAGRLAGAAHLVVAVDALDEVNHPDLPPGANVLFLPASLPPGVFFVVTTRPQHAPRLEVARLRGLELEARGEGNLEDVRAYVRGRLGEEGTRAWAARAGLDEDRLASALLAKSEGNFMYLHYVLNAISAGDFADASLGTLPDGLLGYYQGHWAKMRARDAATFDALHRRVVCALAAARSALSAEELASWLKLDRPQVLQVLRQWREFLYEEAGEDGERRYRIYHTTFREFLATEVDVRLREHKGIIVDTLLDKVRRLWIR